MLSAAAERRRRKQRQVVSEDHLQRSADTQTDQWREPAAALLPSTQGWESGQHYWQDTFEGTSTSTTCTETVS